jgi:uncharacterized phiE125 gp8 family phage protein
MNLLYKTLSATEPVTREQAKTFLGEAGSHYDDLIDDLITAARERAEIYTNRSLIDKQVVLMHDRIPVDRVIKLPRCPVKSVVSVKYLDIDDTWQTLSTELYSVDNAAEPSKIYFKEHIEDLKHGINVVHITYNTGYGNREIFGTVYPNPFPESIKNAILMLVRTMYDQRDDYVKGMMINQVPQSAEYLLNQHRIFEFV